MNYDEGKLMASYRSFPPFTPSNTGVVLPWLQRKKGELYVYGKTDALRGIYGTILGNT